MRHRTPLIIILLALLAVIVGGCTSAPTTAAVQRLRPTPPPFELLRLSHQRMNAVKSFSAQVKVDIRAEGEVASVSMDVERGNDGQLHARIDIDAPGMKQPLEIIIFEDYIYINEGGPGWVRKRADDLSGLGVHAAWAIGVASSVDFFGNLIPQEEIPWETYQAKSLGQEDLAGSPAEHLEIGADLQDMWKQLDEAERGKFILSRVLMVEPQELFDRTEVDTMGFWIDDLGYVRRMHMSMGLSKGMSIELEMIGADFGEDIEITIPKYLQAGGPANAVVSPTPVGVPAGDSPPSQTPSSTLVASPEPFGTITPPGVEAPAPAEFPTPSLTRKERPLTKEEIQFNLGLGLSLRGRNLSGADLSYANLSGARLQGTDLTGVNFYTADLSWSNLRLANLTGANLERADLRFADLRLANLSGVSLAELDLEGVKLDDAQLSGGDLNSAYLGQASLTKADLSNADLARAHLVEADLTKADLTGANLSGANLSMAILTGTNLSDADLSGADLTGAVLEGVNLIGANLTGADLTDTTILRTNLTAADLSEAIVELAFFGEGTTWSKAFCGPVHRCTKARLRERGARVN